MDYKNAKIYRLTCDDPELIYYGATCQTLTKRLSKHKGYSREANNTCKSVQLFKVGNVKIELVEKCPCNDKEELNAIEGRYIRENLCINKNIPGRTEREYYLDNKEKVHQKNRNYYHRNREDQVERSRKYREVNEDQVERSRKYREVNEDKLKERRKERVECPNCNKELSRGGLKRHIKTKHS